MRKNRNTDYILLKSLKLSRKLEYLTEIDKDKKKRKEEIYRNEFLGNPRFEKSNQIPEYFSYEPVVTIATDLVAKENINQLKHGLKKIILKYYTKELFSGFQHTEEIKRYIDNLNENITDNDSWINIGRFDFSNHSHLDKDIAYFDIKVLNFSSSFLAIQFTISMSDERKRELTRLINEDYKGNSRKVNSYYKRKINKSGARKRYVLTTYNKDLVKHIKITEFTTELKWILFNQISKYIPIILHESGEIPPSINIFKTDITLEDNEKSSFLTSVGYNLSRALHISDTSSLVIDPITDSVNNTTFLDYTYIVDTKLKRKEMYASLDDQIVDELDELYSYLIKTHMLKVLSNKFFLISSFYRNQINNVRIKKKSYKKLLALRYAYEKDTNIFKRLFEEIDWVYEKERIESFPLKNKDKLKSPYIYAYKSLTEHPFIIKEKIEKYKDYIKYEIENKITLTSHLKDYNDEGRNHRLNIVNLFISAITFLALLFPSIPINLANQFKKIFLLIPNLLNLIVERIT